MTKLIFRLAYWCYEKLHNLTGAGNFDLARHVIDMNMMLIPIILFAAANVGEKISTIIYVGIALLHFGNIRLARKQINVFEKLAEDGVWPAKRDLDKAGVKINGHIRFMLLNVLIVVIFFRSSYGWSPPLMHGVFIVDGFLMCIYHIACTDIGRQSKEHALSKVFKRKAVLKPAFQRN